MWAPASTAKGQYHDIPIFWGGKNDFGYMTDVNILSALCLEERDSASSLDWVVQNASTRDQFDSQTIEGFSWDAVNKGPVWVKGTEMVVAALHAVGDHSRADFYHAQSRKTQNAAGAIPYSTGKKDKFNRQNPAYSVAATVWFYFNEVKYNPFKF